LQRAEAARQVSRAAKGGNQYRYFHRVMLRC
jgi:hypothetical protein